MFQTVKFHESQLLVAYDEEGNGWVAIRPICEAIGIDTHRQVSKIQEDARFSWRPMSSTGSDGKHYEMICIHITQVNGWLYTINPNKVTNPETKTRLLLYQQECTELMFHHFMPQGGTSTEARSILDRFDQRQDRMESRLEAVEANVGRLHRKYDELERRDAAAAGKRLAEHKRFMNDN